MFPYSLKLCVMKKGLLFTLLFVSFIGFGQCPSVNIRFQSQIDNFAVTYPGCTEFESIDISGNSIVNLDGLFPVETVIGELRIGNTEILDLSGLENLVNVGGDLHIQFNSLLQSLEALHQLQNVGGTLSVVQCDFLQNLSGLNSLTSIGGNFSESGLFIAQNDSLLSLLGLENLAVIDGWLQIEYNNALQSFNGLEGLTQLYGQIFIHSNDNLQTLGGLENLQFFENKLHINFNDKLTSLSTLSDINFSTIQEVSIRSNDQLSFCAVQPVCQAIFSSDAEVFIDFNLTGCNSVPEVEAQCQLSITESDLSENLSFFPNPVSSILNIETSKTISFKQATVYSTLGKLILETFEKQINLETLSAGIYFVEVITDKGVLTKKIVKQ